MHLNGLKKLKTLSLFLIFCFSASASDFGIAMPDQIQEGDYKFSEDDSENSKDNGVDFNLGDRGFDGEIKSGQEEKPFAIMDENIPKKPDVGENDSLLHSGNDVPFTHEGRDSVITFKNKDIHKEIYNKSDTALSLSYFIDQYDVTGRNGVFDRTYDSNGGKRGGSLHLSYDYYLTNGWFNLFYGGGLGLGFSSGEGQFSSSTSVNTNTEFQLFSVPADVRLGFEFVPSRYFKLNVSGGPSVMGLYQSRNDLPRGSEDKHRRQISYGYYGQAKLQLNMSAFFSSLAFRTYSNSDMTNLFLNLEARTQSFENFQDDISITGSSFGLGFTFEYL